MGTKWEISKESRGHKATVQLLTVQKEQKKKNKNKHNTLTSQNAKQTLLTKEKNFLLQI